MLRSLNRFCFTANAGLRFQSECLHSNEVQQSTRADIEMKSEAPRIGETVPRKSELRQAKAGSIHQLLGCAYIIMVG